MTSAQQYESEHRVPDGFQRMPEGLGFGDRLQPFYRRREGNGISLGFHVARQHLNLMGICHGGVLMTLADIAAGINIHVRRERPSPAPTINLSFDFQAAGKEGRWLHTVADHVDIKRRFGFCSGVILDGEKVILRYSGTFYLPEHRPFEEPNAPGADLGILIGDDGPANL